MYISSSADERSPGHPHRYVPRLWGGGGGIRPFKYEGRFNILKLNLEMVTTLWECTTVVKENDLTISICSMYYGIPAVSGPSYTNTLGGSTERRKPPYTAASSSENDRRSPPQYRNIRVISRSPVKSTPTATRSRSNVETSKCPHPHHNRCSAVRLSPISVLPFSPLSLTVYDVSNLSYTLGISGLDTNPPNTHSWLGLYFDDANCFYCYEDAIGLRLV